MSKTKRIKPSKNSVLVAFRWRIGDKKYGHITLADRVESLSIPAEEVGDSSPPVLSSDILVENRPITLYPRDPDSLIRWTVMRASSVDKARELMAQILENLAKGEYSRIEMQDMFLDHIDGLVEETLQRPNLTTRERLDGLVGGILYYLDVGNMWELGYSLYPNVNNRLRNIHEISGLRPYPDPIPNLAGGLQDRFRKLKMEKTSECIPKCMYCHKTYDDGGIFTRTGTIDDPVRYRCVPDCEAYLKQQPTVGFVQVLPRLPYKDMDELDLDQLGTYQFLCFEPLKGKALASALLTSFHRTISISVLEDVDIQAYDKNMKPLPKTDKKSSVLMELNAYFPYVEDNTGT